MGKISNKEHVGIRESDITTVLAEDVEFKGNLSFKTSLMIKGKFEGDIKSEGLLFIDKNAVVKAKLQINTLISYGKITGDITAKRHVVLCEGSILQGDIKTPDITVESGSLFNGLSTMPAAFNSWFAFFYFSIF